MEQKEYKEMSIEHIKENKCNLYSIGLLKQNWKQNKTKIMIGLMPNVFKNG